MFSKVLLAVLFVTIVASAATPYGSASCTNSVTPCAALAKTWMNDTCCAQVNTTNNVNGKTTTVSNMTCYSQYFATQLPTLIAGNTTVMVKCMYNQTPLPALQTCTMDSDCNTNGMTGMCCASRAVTFNNVSQTDSVMSCANSSSVPLSISLSYPNSADSAMLTL